MTWSRSVPNAMKAAALPAQNKSRLLQSHRVGLLPGDLYWAWLGWRESRQGIGSFTFCRRQYRALGGPVLSIQIFRRTVTALGWVGFAGNGCC